jgi:hypothetical protein
MAFRIGSGLPVNETIRWLDFTLENRLGVVAFVGADQPTNDNITLALVIGAQTLCIGRIEISKIVGRGLRDFNCLSERVSDYIFPRGSVII